MPHLMNCPHKGDSHCLDCVKAEWDRREAEKSDLLAALRRLVKSYAEQDGEEGGAMYFRDDIAAARAAIARAEGGAA